MPFHIWIHCIMYMISVFSETNCNCHDWTKICLVYGTRVMEPEQDHHYMVGLGNNTWDIGMR